MREITKDKDGKISIKIPSKGWSSVFGYKEEPPTTCIDCGEPLTDDEFAYFFDNIEDDDDKPYCNGCISKMDATERAVDDSLMEGKQWK